LITAIVLSFSSCKNPLTDIIAKDAAPKLPQIAIKTDSGSIDVNSGICDFGQVTLNSSKDIEITIENNGNGMLNLTGDPLVKIEGTNSTEFSVKTPPKQTINANDTTILTLRFTPKSIGQKTATATISSNDNATKNFSFILKGYGLAIPAPNIKVESNGVGISMAETFDIGSTFITNPKNTVFKIKNEGDAQLNLTGDPKVQISDGESMFTVASQPSTPISPGSYEDFSIKFDPTTVGQKTATITIQSNDPVTSQFSFTLKATATAAPAPNMIIRQGSTNYDNGTGIYDFNQVVADGSGPEESGYIIFLILNTGQANLILSSGIELTGDDSDFELLDTTISPIAPSDSTAFKLNFNPASTGTKQVTISIANNTTSKEATCKAGGFWLPLKGAESLLLLLL